MSDPQYAALGTVQTVDDDELGPVKMQNVLFRLSDDARSIRWAGRRNYSNDNLDLRRRGKG